jgi:hypothetical protein
VQTSLEGVLAQVANIQMLPGSSCLSIKLCLGRQNIDNADSMPFHWHQIEIAILLQQSCQFMQAGKDLSGYFALDQSAIALG